MNGLELTAMLCERLHVELPVIILTGDISTDALRHIAAEKCLQLNKPVIVEELTKAIRSLLPLSAARGRSPDPHSLLTTDALDRLS